MKLKLIPLLVIGVALCVLAFTRSNELDFWGFLASGIVAVATSIYLSFYPLKKKL